jgi:hypothetical protein
MNMTTELTVKEEAAPTTVGGFDLVDPEGAKAYWENYEEVVNAILTKDDYQGTQFKKKSAYRKLATAFQFSDEVVKEDIIKDDKGRVVTAEFHVKATAKNGRFAIGVGMCSLYDKISKKDRTEPSEFELRKRFSNPDHDIISTAHTRAKNRAIADLIGTGEVSAEEMDIAKGGNFERGNVAPTNRRRVRKPAPEKKKPRPEKEPKQEVVEAEVIEKSENTALVLKGTDSVILGDWFRKIIQKLERRGDELTKKNFARISKLWAFDNQYPDFDETICKDLLSHVEEA